ncbi:MAG: beta-propeller domain-containing protein, partial [Acidimicrobiia bacterium]
RRILTVVDHVLTHVDISSGTPVVTDRITLPTGWGHELFFRGDRAFVITNSGVWGAPMPVNTSDQPIGPTDGSCPAAEIVEIDLSVPTDLRVTSSLRIEGQYLSARAIDDHVRIAMTSPPSRLPWLFPQSTAGEDRAEQANRELVQTSTLDDWLPDYVLSGPNGSTTGPLLGCDRIHHPAEFAGFDMVSVLDLDLGEGLAAAVDGPAADAVGVLAGGQTVASSMDRFYVATTTWLPPGTGDASVDDDQLTRFGEEYVTEVHAFAIAPDTPTTYVGSGSVPGTLLNQFSIDEHDGDLRIVHTDGTPWNQGNRDSETFLTVLREDGDRLEPIGSVGGLGRGEQLYAARLMGDVGFAVTFRQIDPFYVLDLSDPTDPRIAGELKIPGFSTYLHPIGDDRVLGLGQDALETGQITGLKLSLFDVSDPADPREVSVWTLPDAQSPAEWDHRAFQMWGSTAFVPVQSWRDGFDGVILFDVTDEITEIGRIRHDTQATPESDCRVIEAATLTPEASDLYWVALDGRLQVCSDGQSGGWQGGWCEAIPAEDIGNWFWDDDVRQRDLSAIDVQPGDLVELCWPDGSQFQHPIQRSLVADGTIYTISPAILQANDAVTLDVIGSVQLR